MPKQVEAWQCDYCPKRYVFKASAKRHEKTCIFNPENKACITCEHSFYKAPDSEPGCKVGMIKQGGAWTKGCQLHKYQGHVGIDYEDGFNCDDYIGDDY